MEIHNLFEETVFAAVEAAFKDINSKNKANVICTCRQCRLDVACYVLNRVKPHYIVSSRGIQHDEQLDIEKQQQAADIASLVYRGIEQVNLNRRPGFKHTPDTEAVGTSAAAYFNIPVIIGRLFNGRTFEPVNGIAVELYMDGQLAVMKDANWQNPCELVKKTEGTFTFWPASVPAGQTGEQKLFNFLIKASLPEMPPLVYYFELPVISEKDQINAVTMNRTHKISDLYLFDVIEE
ncbi:MAG: late competence development ComFB family protein, partial [Spirochaetaceae bacterium]|nr:late competence development ComFB family protein [Spirochaetaceae bacterium]